MITLEWGVVFGQLPFSFPRIGTLWERCRIERVSITQPVTDAFKAFRGAWQQTACNAEFWPTVHAAHCTVTTATCAVSHNPGRSSSSTVSLRVQSLSAVAPQSSHWPWLAPCSGPKQNCAKCQYFIARLMLAATREQAHRDRKNAQFRRLQ